jgi:hypothetical protein
VTLARPQLGWDRPNVAPRAHSGQWLTQVRIV